MSALYLRDLYKLALCLCSQVRGLSSYFLPTPPVPLGQGPPNHTFPFPGLATQKITVSFSELVLDAKLAFSILHKVQETVATCLREELFNTPWVVSGF